MEINRWYQQHSNHRTHKINTMKNISTRQIIDVKNRLGAIQVANEKMEIVRNLKYDDMT